MRRVPGRILRVTMCVATIAACAATAVAQQRPLDECVRWGSASAAIVVTRVGCAPAMPTAEEIDAFLADPAHREAVPDDAAASSNPPSPPG